MFGCSIGVTIWESLARKLLVRKLLVEASELHIGKLLS